MNLLILALLVFDLTTVRQEPNLERRSDLALDNAALAVAACGQAYKAGDLDKTKAEATEIEESVTLAYDSLRDTGKDPRKSPKFFKHAEVSTRQLLRRLDDLIGSMSSADRAMLLVVRDRVSDIHEDLLNGIMRKKN
jgi:hypothetical protein